jgi:hypothetical protein
LERERFERFERFESFEFNFAFASGW